MNDIIHYALTPAGVPARLEPPGLLCSDGKRPDGVSMVPWRSGKFLVWDAMCVATFAPSYRSLAAQAAGAVVAKAESLKKYSDLFHMHEFVAITMESSGVLGLQSLASAKELEWKLRYQTREEKAVTYLIQCLSNRSSSCA